LNRARRRIVAPVAALAALAAVCAVAPRQAGALSRVDDPKDSRRPLDIRQVESNADSRGVAFRIQTHGRWRTRSLRDRAYFVVYLDTIATPGDDFYVLARSNGRRLRGALYRKRARGRDRRLSGVRVRRLGRRSIFFGVRLGRVQLVLGRPYLWHAQTLATSRRCKRVCFDHAPNTGAVQDVPIAGPAP
jgi:hypothetical protein